MGSCFTCHELGNGVLQPGRGQGKNESHDRPDQLINPHIFFAEQPGKKDAVKETDEAADEACDCKNDRSGDQGIFLNAHTAPIFTRTVTVNSDRNGSFGKYMQRSLLTERRGGVILTIENEAV